MIFVDHEKTEYLKDFLLLVSYGAVKQGTLVIGDNMIRPGAPDYVEYFKNSTEYKSIF